MNPGRPDDQTTDGPFRSPQSPVASRGFFVCSSLACINENSCLVSLPAFFSHESRRCPTSGCHLGLSSISKSRSRYVYSVRALVDGDSATRWRSSPGAGSAARVSTTRTAVRRDIFPQPARHPPHGASRSSQSQPRPTSASIDTIARRDTLIREGIQPAQQKTQYGE